MALMLIVAALSLLFIYAGFKFYRGIDWEEKPSLSPDFKALRKKEAELLHIFDLLDQARRDGKLSQQTVDEFGRYADGEVRAMRDIETAWQARKKGTSDSAGKN